MKTKWCEVPQICLMLGVVLMSTYGLAQVSQSTWENQVRIQLDAFTLTFGNYKLVPSHDPIVYSLDRNTYVDIRYQLDRGESYIFVGVCDTDCREINMVLYDEDGRVIDSSTRRHDVTPAVGARAYEDTMVRVQITMAECRHNPCWVGVGAYTR